MKEIVILFFTFLGICKTVAQNAADKTMPNSLKNNVLVMKKPVTGAALDKEKSYR
jgi:hypothetical protein